ncbi:MAG: DNA-protecting protein DprA [Clostridiaceae bacterium]|nr:DNA-protecting protein DprA [Clostridiaceae bacterium]
MAYIFNQAWKQLDNYFKENNLNVIKQRAWLEQFSDIEQAIYSLNKNNMNKIIKSSDPQRIRVVTILDSDYPKLLKEIYDPPALLYLLGNDLHYDEKLTVSVIGSRHSTNYGEKVTRMIVEALQHPERTIVSGMAIGIDSIAQISALKCGMNSIAVLGSGVDVCYPKSKINLYEDLIEKGSIVSEYPPGTPPKAYHFPIRNRIISGLSSALIVAEAGLKSGTMITAECAINQGRDVFAIPGSVFMKQSQGCHQLINDGARIIVDQNAIFSLAGEFSTSIPPQEKKLLAFIHQLQPNFTQLINALKYQTSELSILLGKLEAIGYIEQQFGKFVLTDKGMSALN